MATKSTQSVSETPSDGNSLVESAIESFLRKGKKNLNFPEEFINKIKKYARRNAFTLDYTIHDGERETIKVCCSKCLKAHVLEKAKEMGLGDDVMDKLDEIFECETGHNGYYIDKEELKKI